MVIFDSPYLVIQYNEKLQAMTEEWKLDFTVLPLEGDKVREPLTKLLEEFKTRKLSKWLCDNTEQKIIASPDQHWLEEYYYPELIKNGLKTAALVNAKNILRTDNAKNCLQNLEEEKTYIEIFNKNLDARAWLEKA